MEGRGSGMGAPAQRVLVVEDNLPNLKMLEAKLRDRYFDVQVATSGAEALGLLDAQDFDVVLLDVMMPGLDGFEVCRQIKLRPRAVALPVIMITALDTPTDRQAGFLAGADDFLIKPVEDEVLFGRMRDLVGRRTAKAV